MAFICHFIFEDIRSGYRSTLFDCCIVGTLLLAAFSYHMLESPWIERARKAG